VLLAYSRAKAKPKQTYGLFLAKFYIIIFSSVLALESLAGVVGSVSNEMELGESRLED